MQKRPKYGGERQDYDDLRMISADHRLRYKWATRTMPEGCTVTDVGCGTGYGCKILSEKASKVVGYDVSIDAVEDARRYWPSLKIDFWIGDMTRPESVPDWGDVATAFEIIEHVEHPETILRNIRSKTLFASVPDQDGHPFDPKKNPFHFRHYTKHEFGSLLVSTGWLPMEWMYQRDKNDCMVRPWDGRPGKTIIVRAERKK